MLRIEERIHRALKSVKNAIQWLTLQKKKISCFSHVKDTTRTLFVSRNPLAGAMEEEIFGATKKKKAWYSRSANCKHIDFDFQLRSVRWFHDPFFNLLLPEQNIWELFCEYFLKNNEKEIMLTGQLTTTEWFILILYMICSGLICMPINSLGSSLGMWICSNKLC